MKYRVFGPSGLRVSEVALGTMTFGTAWGWGADETASRAIFGVYREAGGNFIDTAVNYTDGQSEELLGRFIGADRDALVIASKYVMGGRDSDVNASGVNAKNLARSVETSLRRLRTDYLDVLWVHAWDFLIAPEMVMAALDRVVRAGTVLHVAISDTPAWLVARMQTIAELRASAMFCGLQIRYSLLDRDVEAELVPMARSLGLTICAWGALGRGILSGKLDAPEALGGRRVGEIAEPVYQVAAAVRKYAGALGCTPSQLALAWLMRQPDVIPIVGARTPEQLEDNLQATTVALPNEVIEALEEASAPSHGFPYDLLATRSVKDMIYSGEHSHIAEPPSRWRTR